MVRLTDFPNQKQWYKAIHKFRQQHSNLMSNTKWYKLFDFLREKMDKPHHIDSIHFTLLNFNEYKGYTFKKAERIIALETNDFFDKFFESRVSYIDFGGPLMFNEFLEFAIPFEAQYAQHDPIRGVQWER